MTPPIALTDDELQNIMAAASPLPPWQRDQFLNAVAAALKGRDLGPGLVHRIAIEEQRRPHCARLKGRN
jgi:hypothetical protein